MGVAKTSGNYQKKVYGNYQNTTRQGNSKNSFEIQIMENNPQRFCQKEQVFLLSGANNFAKGIRSTVYTLLFEKFGSRRIDLLISTDRRRKTDTVANRLLTREVVYVGKSIGELTIHLRAEIIIKDKMLNFQTCLRRQRLWT